MKFNFKPIFIIGALLLCNPIKNFSQTLNLGAVEPFTMFTVAGGVANTGVSSITGNIGTNFGIISGFGGSTVNGSTEQQNAVTAQAKIDLLNIYIVLNNVPVTNTTHGSVFTNETVAPGVYLSGAAGSFDGTVTLNGGANAVFIFKFEGAFSMPAGAIIALTGGARSCNVFFLSEGSISAGANSTLKGNFISHPGAVSMGAGCTLDGRLLSTSGAITLNAGAVSKPTGLSNIPIECIGSCTNPILGSTIASFALFSSVGDVGNTSISGVIGDIGSNAGAVTSWGTSIVIGTLQNANAVTALAVTQLNAAYTDLMSRTATVTTHGSVLGGGETLFAGVYDLAAAVSVAGTLYLDGQGNANSTFIFRCGAAFGTAAASKVILINGARRCNIFWIAQGAISMGSFTFMKGTLIAKDGANNMGANGFLEGRMLSTAGAVNFNTATTYIGTTLCGTPASLPVSFITFTGYCEQQQTMLKWSTGVEINSKNFIVERSVGGSIWESVGIVKSAGNSVGQTSYSFIDKVAAKFINYYYRLKQVDFDNNFKYSTIINVNKCSGEPTDKLSVFPNPSTGKVNLWLTEDQSKVTSTEIYNSEGAKIYQSNMYNSQIDISNKAAGIYYIRILVNSKIISSRIALVK